MTDHELPCGAPRASPNVVPFEEANYGCSAFRAFLARPPHRVRNIGQSGEDLRIQLIEPSRERTNGS